jgi:hypothetical protein
MTIAIMQPYVFPYIGYFQLIFASDVFVFYDDVNYINRGWINRNRILLNGKEHMITVPCRDASQNRLIMDIEVMLDAKTLQKLLTTIQTAYKKAPFFSDVYPVLEQSLMTGTLPYVHPAPTSAFPMFTMDIAEPAAAPSIADVAIRSVVNICDYLGLKRTFKRSSAHYNNRELKKADRLIDICHLEGIDHYVNASGGKAIYDKEYYAAKNIKLDFLNPIGVEYVQFNNTFVPWLSMIDILMFNSREEVVNKILPSYYLD